MEHGSSGRVVGGNRYEDESLMDHLPNCGER